MAYKQYVCSDTGCKHTVLAEELPIPMKWDDGHVCYFINKKAQTKEEREERNDA